MKIKSNTLYRKYRPENFDEVMGQEDIVNILEKSIESNNISHAYLFSGDRGTGKTSIARIFAKKIGCSSDDIYEMDAASNRGINEIREIRDSVDILPMSSEYKVYIIDEVHMLTKDAFNALLKTLEEPPKHVIFILATTEKEKILPTIISRCQTFEFKNPNNEILKDLIKKVSEKENRLIGDDVALLEIAKKGNGSFRDTLSVLQKVITSIDGEINIDNIKKLFGESFGNLEDDFLKYISEKDKEKVFEIYFELKKNNFSLDLFLNNILEKIRDSLLLKNSLIFEKSFSSANKDFLKNIKINSGHLKKFLDIENIISKSSQREISFELFLIEFFE